MVCILVSCTQSSWNEYFRDLLDFSSFGKLKGLEELVARFNFFVKLYESYYFGGTLGYGLAAFLAAPYCNEINQKKDLHLICDTFVPIWVPFDLPYWARITIFVIQFILINLALSPAAVSCFVVVECSEYLCLHILQLKRQINLVLEKRMPLRSWVQYHNHVIK